MTDTVALIVAAGRGHRVGAPLPKQYLTLGNRAILARTVSAFAAMPEIDAVRVVFNPTDRALYDKALGNLPENHAAKLLEPVAGGAERQDSVRNGLDSLESLAPRAVLIHDGARPFADRALIGRTLAALNEFDGAIAALPVSDTLKREGAEGGRIEATVSRAELWRAQTPQTFRFDAILAAHRAAAGKALTDDAAVAEEAGLSVALVLGSEENLKVTDPADMARAERQIAARLADIRVGQGVDVHKFGPGDHVMLCGVRITHEQGLVGHSDADVGLHALVDAVLGALGAGDIGSHFPPSEPEWKGANSSLFARHAAKLVAEAGGAIGHLDLTILCEAPKIGSHREALRAGAAAAFGIEVGRVSVKATTTEKLGFLGRGEGMAGMAMATIRLPLGGGDE